MINQIELAEKFNEIFIDKETVEYFNKWYAEKQGREDTRTWWQKNNFSITMLTIMFLFLGSLLYSYFRPHVDHGVYKRGSGDVRYTTWVYYNGEIIKSYSIPIEELTDSAKQHHKEAGDALLRTLSK